MKIYIRLVISSELSYIDKKDRFADIQSYESTPSAPLSLWLGNWNALTGSIF
jgi:hypothetical protein